MNCKVECGQEGSSYGNRQVEACGTGEEAGQEAGKARTKVLLAGFLVCLEEQGNGGLPERERKIFTDANESTGTPLQTPQVLST